MCVTIEIQPNYFSFEKNEQYEKEVALMRKRMEKLFKKVEKNESKLVLLDKGNNFQQFKESLRDTNENLKK